MEARAVTEHSAQERRQSCTLNPSQESSGNQEKKYKASFKDPHPAAWLVLSGASAGGFALSFVFSQLLLHAGEFWRTPVLADPPGAI